MHTICARIFESISSLNEGAMRASRLKRGEKLAKKAKQIVCKISMFLFDRFNLNNYLIRHDLVKK